MTLETHPSLTAFEQRIMQEQPETVQVENNASQTSIESLITED